MIEIYEGRIGGGKTYKAVKHAARLMAEGLTVATNIELLWDGFCAYVENEYGVIPDGAQWIDLRGVELKDFHKVTPAGERGAPVTVIIDEAHLTFNSRDWAQCSRDLLAFLTQSRKQYTDVIFISQSMQNIDKQFRVLNQFVWRFKDLTKFTVPGIGITWAAMIQIITLGICKGDWMLEAKFDYDNTTLLGRNFVRRDERVFKAYNTDAIVKEFERSGAVKRKTLERSNSRGAVLRVVMVFIALAFVIGYWVWKSNRKEPEKEAVKEKAGVAQGEKVSFRNGELEPRQDESVAARFGMATQKDVKAAAAAYDVFAEQFRSFYGGRAPELKTSGGSYRQGQMSSKGFVVAVAGQQARILQPNGRVGWVVAEDAGNAAGGGIEGAEMQFKAPAVVGPTTHGEIVGSRDLHGNVPGNVTVNVNPPTQEQSAPESPMMQKRRLNRL